MPFQGVQEPHAELGATNSLRCVQGVVEDEEGRDLAIHRSARDQGRSGPFHGFGGYVAGAELKHGLGG